MRRPDAKRARQGTETQRFCKSASHMRRGVAKRQVRKIYLHPGFRVVERGGDGEARDRMTAIGCRRMTRAEARRREEDGFAITLIESPKGAC
jgi:hypothetical protein